jgi:peroxiredoxin Q/BCP
MLFVKQNLMQATIPFYGKRITATHNSSVRHYVHIATQGKRMIKLNCKVKDFELPATGDKTIRLSDYLGRNVVIYFYPKDSTPGCTTEGQNFRDAYEQLQQCNTEVLGISRDTIRTHENFKAKQSFPFDLLSDKDEIVCKLFDVIKLKKNYGREYLGIERSTFLIDEKGKLYKEWRKVKVKGHVDEVLEHAKALYDSQIKGA